MKSKPDRGEELKPSKRGKRAPDDPFPDHKRPLPGECRAARNALALLHGEPERPELDLLDDQTVQSIALDKWNQRTVLDSLVRTILSQNTTDTNSQRAFQSLKSAFSSWEAIRTAPPDKVEEAIKSGGLAKTKTERMKAILDTLMEERGCTSLEHLRQATDEDIKTELSRFKGVGPKSIACVMMFCLARAEFPVDTHVWRISKALAWVPKKATREEAYAHLNRHVPQDIKYDLHVLLVEHGKRCARCASGGKPRKEPHGPCPLFSLSAAVDEGEPLSGVAAVEDLKEEIEVKEEAPKPMGKGRKSARKIKVKTEPGSVLTVATKREQG